MMIMKKILLSVLFAVIWMASFAQFQAGEYIEADSFKVHYSTPIDTTMILYVRHLALEPTDSAKIALHVGDSIIWAYRDSININGAWYHGGDSVTVGSLDSLFYNGVWTTDTIPFFAGDSTFIGLYDTPDNYPATDKGYGLIASDEAVLFSDYFGNDNIGFWAKTNGTSTINSYINQQVIIDSTGTWSRVDNGSYIGYTLNNLGAPRYGSITYQANVINGNTYDVYLLGKAYASGIGISDTISFYVDGILYGKYYNGAGSGKLLSTYTATATETIDLQIIGYNCGAIPNSPSVGFISLFGQVIVDNGSVRIINDAGTVYKLPGYKGAKGTAITSDGSDQLIWSDTLTISAINSRTDTVYIPTLRVDTVFVANQPINLESDSIFDPVKSEWLKNGDSLLTYITAAAAASTYLPLSGGTLTGNLLFTDNTYDIGASGATRPRTGYFGTSVFSPLIVGGSAAGSKITYKSTTGTGTPTGIAHQWLGGTNGGTTIATMLNNAYLGIRITAPQTDFETLYPLTKRRTTNGTTAVPYEDAAVLYSSSGIKTTGMYFYNEFTSANSSFLGFKVENAGSSIDAIRINKLGNVGIGTTAPGALLDIGGGSSAIPGIARRVIITANDNNIQSLHLQNLNTGTAAEMRFVAAANATDYLAFTTPSTGNTGTFFGLTSSTGSFIFAKNRILALGTFDDDDFVFGTDNVERARLTAAGILGIGTVTPVAGSKIDVNGEIAKQGSILVLDYLKSTAVAAASNRQVPFANGSGGIGWGDITMSDIIDLETIDSAAVSNIVHDSLATIQPDSIYVAHEAEWKSNGDTIHTGSMAAKQFWTGTQAAYDAIGTKDENTLYFIELGYGWFLLLLLMSLFSGSKAQNWNAVYSGSTEMQRIYSGETLVWEKVSPFPDSAMVMTFSIPSDNYTLTIPFLNTTGYDCVIDWGDGSPLSTITTYNDADRIHVYSTAGTYDLQIAGIMKGIYFNNDGNKDQLIAIKQWGDVGMISSEAAFDGCNNATALNDFDNYPLTEIETYAFAYWTNINQELIIPSNVTTIGYRAFSSWETNSYELNIPNSVTYLEQSVFEYWYSCPSLVFNANVSSILSNTFADWTGATSLDIQSNVNNINYYAFGGWTSATYIHLPSSITNIANFAFYDCSAPNLIIYCDATTPPTLGGSSVFDGIHSTALIKVPSASVTTYQTATYWSEYAAKIISQ
jgi:hypothetical protein